MTIALANCRIVLVRPHFAGNLGSVARVMRNFGLTDLVLVTPFARPDDPEAQRMSTHGSAILAQARIVETFEDALADCVMVLATSAAVEGLYREHLYGRPDELLPRLLPHLIDAKTALVFGPEPSGLTTEEITRCHGLMRILTDSDYTSLNLAQAVAVCLYELKKCQLNAQDTANKPTQPVAPFAEQERMFAHLETAFYELRFLFGGKSDALMHAFRQLIVRAGPSPIEVRILHGLARQIRWYIKHAPLPDDVLQRPLDDSSSAST